MSVERARRVAAGTAIDPRLGMALNAIAAATVRLAQVDPVTTEVVRIRCAQHHDCGT